MFNFEEPGTGDRLLCLSPLRGLFFIDSVFLGLTPQAMCLSPLRGYG